MIHERMFLCISITPEIIQFQLICKYLYIKSLIVQVDLTKLPEDIGLLCHLEEVADEELEEEASPAGGDSSTSGGGRCFGDAEFAAAMQSGGCRRRHGLHGPRRSGDAQRAAVARAARRRQRHGRQRH